jgi:hypothetical protein
MFVNQSQFPDSQERIRLTYDPDVVPESGTMFINQSQFLESQEPIRLTYDPDVVPESGSILVSQFNQFALVPEPMLILDPSVVQASGHLFVNQLDGLHEYRRGVTQTLRTLTQDLRSVEFVEVANGLLQTSDLTVTAQCNFAQPSGNEPNFCVLSMHSCMGVTGFSSIVQEVLAQVVSIAHYSRNVLQQRLSQCKRELRRTSALVVIIEKAAFSAVSFFCCVRWERRRWFLHHGARPPKQPVQAMLSLFTGACSGSLIAY